MSNFNWQLVQTRPPLSRYMALPANDVLGLAQWELFAQRFPYPTPAAAWPFLQSIHRAGLSRPPRPCPRVFVSHRHIDANHALSIAWLAHQAQFEYWLDVLNIPPLWAQLGFVAAGFNSTILIAALIEMALINCTHVLAVMTPDTAGSEWVPYEYGRIKDDPPALLTASCWRRWDLPLTDLPEYLHLAPIHHSESDILNWFQLEKSHFPLCHWPPSSDWPGGTPERLPEGP